MPGARLFDAQLRRLEQDEIGAPFDTARFIGLHHYGRDGDEEAGGRANSIQAVHLCTISVKPKHGTWHPVEDLPDGFLEGQRPLIDMAVVAFEEQK